MGLEKVEGKICPYCHANIIETCDRCAYCNLKFSSIVEIESLEEDDDSFETIDDDDDEDEPEYTPIKRYVNTKGITRRKSYQARRIRMKILLMTIIIMVLGGLICWFLMNEQFVAIAPIEAP